MRLDLLSYQKPEQKSYWWIHDMELWDFEKYKAPNTFTMTKTYEEETKADVFVRTFVSKKGGDLGIKIGDEQLSINTYDSNLNQFQCINLGEFDFSKGDNEIVVENLKGFQAVNLFAIIPQKDQANLQFKLEQTIKKTYQFVYLEAESDFSYEGNIQSSRVYPKLSMGKAISSFDGNLKTSVDIIKADKYSFSLNVNAYNGNDGYLDLEFENMATKEVIKKVIDSNTFKKDTENKIVVVDKDLYNDSFPQLFKELNNEMNYYQRVDLNDIYLEKGSYELTITFHSNVPSVTNFGDLHKFDPNEIAASDFVEDQFASDDGYCFCEEIDNSMMNDSTYLDDDGNEVFKVIYDPTCSKDWYDYASEKIEVDTDQEYLFQATSKSTEIYKRHLKVIFLDEFDNIVDTTYINEVEEQYKSEWNSYEQIIQVPAEAKKMQVHILARGNQDNYGIFEMYNYSLVPYNQLIAVDSVTIYEGDDFDNFMILNTDENAITYSRVDTMKRDFELFNENHQELLINYHESPNPLWNMTLGDYSERGNLILNGVSTGFITDNSGVGSIEIILRKPYYLSFVFVFVGIIIFIVSYLNADKLRIKRKRKSKRKRK